MSLSVVHDREKPQNYHALKFDNRCGMTKRCGSDCSLAKCAVLHTLGARRDYLAGESIFWEDDVADHYYMVVSGVVRGFQLLSDGRRQIHRFMFPGNLIAHTVSQQYTYTAEAVTPVQVLAISRHLLDEQVDEIPELRHLVNRSVLEELQEAQDQVVVLGKMSAKERVAHFLVNLAKHLGAPEDAAIEIPMTRSDIADHLGLTIETVSRVFGRLKREGKISLITTNRVSVPNPDQLCEDFHCGEI